MGPATGLLKSSGSRAALSHVHDDEGTSTTFPLRTGSACSLVSPQQPQQAAGRSPGQRVRLSAPWPGCFHPTALRGVGRALAKLLCQDPCDFTFYL